MAGTELGGGEIERITSPFLDNASAVISLACVDEKALNYGKAYQMYHIANSLHACHHIMVITGAITAVETHDCKEYDHFEQHRLELGLFLIENGINPDSLVTREELCKVARQMSLPFPFCSDFEECKNERGRDVSLSHECGDGMNDYFERNANLINTTVENSSNFGPSSPCDTTAAQQETPMNTADIVNESTSGEFSSASPDVNGKSALDDVVGMEIAKNMIRDSIMMPMRFPEVFNQTQINPCKALLLFGEPGTGKSHLCNAIAQYLGAKFIKLSATDFSSSYIGDSEQCVRSFFNQAIADAPSVLFIDEIDGLMSKRCGTENETYKKIKTEFLIQLTTLAISPQRVFFIAATNRPYDLDSALLSRFDTCVYVPLPVVNDRVNIFKIQLKKLKHSLTDADILDFAKKTEGYSGRELTKVVNIACQYTTQILREAQFFKLTTHDGEAKFTPCSEFDPGAISMDISDIPNGKLYFDFSVGKDQFCRALNLVRKSTKKEETEALKKFNNEFGAVGQIPRQNMNVDEEFQLQEQILQIRQFELQQLFQRQLESGRGGRKKRKTIGMRITSVLMHFLNAVFG